MLVHKYQPCPVSISLDYAGPQVSVAVIIVTIMAVVYCCVLQGAPGNKPDPAESGESLGGQPTETKEVVVLAT